MSQAERAKATKRLGFLLASDNPDEQAEAERLLKQADDENNRLAFLKEAVQVEQAALDNGDGPLVFATTMLAVFAVLIAPFATRGSGKVLFVNLLLLITAASVAICLLQHHRKRSTKKQQLQMVALRAHMVRLGEWRVGEDLMKLGWSYVPEGAVEEALQRTLNDWFARFAANNPNDVLPEWSDRLVAQARSLLQVRGWGKSRRVVPRGPFSDARVDFLVTLCQHFMARPDYRTRQRQFVELAAQLEATTDNHAFVRDVAQVLLRKSDGTVAATIPPATAPQTTISSTPPTPTVVQVGQRQP